MTLATGFDILHDNGDEATTTNWSSSSSTSTPVREEWKADWDAVEEIAADRIPSTTPGAEPPRDARDSGSARSHSTHLETSSSNRP